jgi:hypothetical protein
MLSAAALALGGCAVPGSSTCYGRPAQTLLDATHLKEIFTGMAAELCQSPCARDCAADRPACPAEATRQPVLVTDFANLETYIPGLHGLLMGEMMRAGLSSQCCHRIVQAEFGKHFKLSEQGLVALTRNIEEIRRDDVPGRDIVVGTYSFQGSKLALFARRIDSRSGIVGHMASREINFSCQGDRVSGQVD